MDHVRKMIVTDLDGTLLNTEGSISEKNYSTLLNAGRMGHLRVIATGRSLYSSRKVIDDSTPIDYLVCSTGACIVDWKNNDILYAVNLTKKEVFHTFQFLNKLKLDYIIQEPVPENHKCMYYQHSSSNSDMESRNRMYDGFVKEIEIGSFEPSESCQFIVIVPGENSFKYYEKIKKELPGLNVIRTTSPIDHQTLWIEIYSKNVSKGIGIQYIADKLGISLSDIMVVGNDFNDLDMLRLTGNGFVVGNAPEDLKKEFHCTATNNLDGFTEAVNFFLDPDTKKWQESLNNKKYFLKSLKR